MRRGRPRGAAAVELALVLPVLMLLVLGAIDFGRFAYNYIAVTNAARAGAAYGSMNPYSTATLPTWIKKVQDATRDEMFNQTGYVGADLTVNVTAETSGETSGMWRVNVVASYPFKTIVNWPGIPTSDGNSMTLTRRVVLRAIR